MVFSPERAAPWGKIDDDFSHHLAHHCADVAACFEAIARQPCFSRALARAAGRELDPITLERLSLMVFLHDMGKLHPGFQARGWVGANGIEPHGHTGEGLGIFLNGIAEGRIAKSLHVETLAGWGSGQTLVDLLHGVLAHHGRPVRMLGKHLDAWDAGRRSGYDPVAAAADIGRVLPRWFPQAFQPGAAALPEAPAFQHLFSGLVALADWLGSDRRQFAFVAELDPDYIEGARGKACKAVRGVGLDTATWRAAIPESVDFGMVTPGRRPRAAQAAVGEWSLDDLLVILEAETGSGKTEAALWRFARLFAAGRVEGLYFAVPTRAAAKQLHARVHAAMLSVFGAGAPQAVLAVPGYLRAGLHEGQALPRFEVLWDDAPDEAVRLGRWAAESARRFLAAPVAVGTVDQAMLAGLQVKHAHLRGAALARSLLVIDEVHASDPYMTAIQSDLLDTHLRRGGYAMLMSATLGSTARNQWLGAGRRAPPPLGEAIDTPYPAVWGRNQGMTAVPGEGHDKAVAIELLPSWSASIAAERAVAAASAGARVLMIRNTVAAAVAAFEAVRERAGESLLLLVAGRPALHHSRFASEDRELLDAAVEAALSPDMSRRSGRGVIVIGTQTLEQSLDIDADILITDLCPVDVLLQRIGRLHRHALPRPPDFEQPRCLVLAPEEGLDGFAAPKFENGIGMFSDGGGVYRNLHACELTRRLIESHPQWRIPAMNRFLVESATHPEAIEALTKERGRLWSDYWNRVYGKDLADAQAGRGMRLDTAIPFSELQFPEDEDRVRTRLGAEGARILFSPGTIGPFGGAISAIACPAHWKGIAPEGPVTAEYGPDGALRFTVGTRTLFYGRKGFTLFY